MYKGMTAKQRIGMDDMRRIRKDEVKNGYCTELMEFTGDSLYTVLITDIIMDQEINVNAPTSAQRLIEWSDEGNYHGLLYKDWQYEAADTPAKLWKGHDGHQ